MRFPGIHRDGPMVSCPGLSVKPLIPRRRHAARKTAGRSLVTGVEKAALQRPPLPEPARDCPPCRNGEWQGRRERRSPAARQWQFRHCPQRAPVVGWTAGRTRPVRNKLPSPPKKTLDTFPAFGEVLSKRRTTPCFDFMHSTISIIRVHTRWPRIGCAVRR